MLDTIQATFEFPGGVCLNYDATLGNSFEGAYEVLYGTSAAVLFRDGKAWMFKEVDSPLFGWEVYAAKDQFYKDTGIALAVDASKPKPAGAQAPPLIATTPLYAALQTFALNAIDFIQTTKDYIEAYGKDDVEGLHENLAKEVRHRPAAGYTEGYQAAVTAIKANEAILGARRVDIPPDLYELGS